MSRNKHMRQLAGELVRQEFAGVSLGHKDRTTRAQEIASQMARKPRASIPSQVDGHWSATKATYDFLKHQEVVPSALRSGHEEQTRLRAAQHEEVLSIQDTTFTRYERTGRQKGLGPIATFGDGQGLCVHSALLVSWPGREVLGVPHQETWARPRRKRPANESCQERKARPRESEKWLRGIESVSEWLFEEQERAPCVTHVFDAEGDTFEAIESCQERQEDYVIRAARNRLLEETEPGGGRRYSLDEVRRAPVLFRHRLRVPRQSARAGMKGREQRETEVEVRVLSVTLRPPKNRGRRGESLTTNLVAIVEPCPPPKTEPIEWFLLTSHPVETRTQVLEVVARYQARWLIEELHMGIKTGCAHEERQLQSTRGLQNHLVFSTVIAWKLLWLRDMARRTEPWSASRVLTESQLETLRGLYPNLSANCDAREALRTIAKLGGFLGRKGDGEPGWRRLWSGFEQLLTAERGYRAAGQRTSSNPSGSQPFL